MSEDFNENDLIFKLVKIYLVEYLTTVRTYPYTQMDLKTFSMKQSIY